MSEEEYAWARALVIFAWQQADATDPERPGLALDNVTARLGQFRNAAEDSANDAELAAWRRVFLEFLVFIWLWNRAKYRAYLPENRAIRAGNFQIPGLGLALPASPETLAPQGFAGLAPRILIPVPPAKYPAPS